MARATMVLVASTALAAHATEGGGSVYPNGTENFMAGALPPPGLYGMVFLQNYRTTRVNGNDGQNLNVPGFSVTANVVAPRLVWVPGVQLLGGDMVVHVIAPLVDLQVHVAGNSQSKTGLGDLTTGIGIGYHHSPHLHSVVALDLYLPTGGYHKADLANIGRNQFAVEPVYALSYIDPAGLNADFKLGYIVNSRNKDTDYTSGGEFHSDFSLGWAVAKGWTAGVGGYVYQQLTDDKSAGTSVANNKGRAFALGPSVKYDSGTGWFATVKWQAETAVRNRAQGQALWVKAVFPL
ncbi:MAG: transporter [Ferruginibacter sp.]|nr:transporter [Rhodoferax sp.]